ncbi:hypothetical protein QNA08_09155 [Chelatococcus sp. SYSU_G07232]|uniref:Uncharacterized protein n=1 Tax=Chelatococcus albus TaxID=3047466 RepID=A0ABT7AGB2_9HYPH|nr:hypothetical protein [Chelatococcus sp. SYSU_G07232]MDJ1158399.1 hypothetical protein [Chelatococcus sp. SYSU_G07232]
MGGGGLPEHAAGANGEILPDGVIDRASEGAQPIIVRAGQIEIDAEGAVRRELGAREKRPAEIAEDDAVDDVGKCVQLAHEAAEGRVHACEHPPVELGTAGKTMPDPARLADKALDRQFAAGPDDRPVVAELAAAAGEERRSGGADASRPPRIEAGGKTFIAGGEWR